MNNEDIKVLEEMIRVYKQDESNINYSDYYICKCKTERQAIENLIKGYKELEVINKMQEYRINVIDEREFIPKSKVREKIEKIENEDLVIHDDRDSEDVIIAKYEQIAVLDFCEELLQEGDK